MAVSLSLAGIETTLIPDSAIFAVMSRVNKVLLGCHAVTANGGLVASCGSQIVSTAAQHHSTPVVVCTGLHKLSPVYPYDTDAFVELIGPERVLGFDQGDAMGDIQVLHPYYDYVVPDLVSLFITNQLSSIFFLRKRFVCESTNSIFLFFPLDERLSFPLFLSVFLPLSGPHPPQYIHRVLTDQYSSVDNTLTVT